MFYGLGKRDALAETFMLIRNVGHDAALKELATALLESCPDHPHAKWYIENAPIRNGP